MRALSGSRLAAIGVGTQDELRRFSLSADVVPSEFRAESLVAALQGSAPGKRFLLVRASRGREVLAEELASAGGSVTQVVAYESRDVASADSQILELLDRQEIDWITVTSSAIARSLHRMFGDGLKSARLASISPVTSATLVELGLNVAAEARQYTASGLVTAILAANQH
jgi:uroporphyrinogen III methyltransferase/synthase